MFRPAWLAGRRISTWPAGRPDRFPFLLPIVGLCSGKWQAIKTVPCGRWTPERVRFVTSPFHCLHELDRQIQPSWWVCHDWKLQINRLLFAVGLVLLFSTESGLQCALNSFADACNTAGMKISTAKTEVLHLSRNPDQCVLQVNKATVKQVEKFKYLGVAFTSAVRQDEALVTRIGKASVVMRVLHYSGVMKRELSKKAKLSVFKTVFVPILTSSHESWVMIERMRSQVQASEMRFSQKIEEVILFNKVRSSEIRKSLNIEPVTSPN